MKTAAQLRDWLDGLDDRTAPQNVPLHLAAGRALAEDIGGLPAGTTLTPAALALLAEHGVDPVPTFSPTGVGLVTIDDDLTGNEDPGDVAPDPARAALIGAAGLANLLPVDMGAVPSRTDLHVAAVHRAFDMAEIVCTVGADAARTADVAEQLGGEVLATSLDEQPGGFSLVACEDGFWVGLPIAPAEALALFCLFVAPLARRIAGHEHFAWPIEAADHGPSPTPPTWCWADAMGEPLHEPGAMTLAAAVRAEGLVLLGGAATLVRTR